MWQPQIEHFTDCHCLVPDLPEHGRSANVKPFSIQRSAEHVADLIARRGHGGRVHVVGLSAGAQVAVALLATAPELVDHAMISSALVRPLRFAMLVTPRLVSVAFRTLVAPFKNVDWWARLNMRYAAGIPARYYPEFRLAFTELTESSFTNLLIENQRFRVPPRLDRVRAPTLIVVGGREGATMHQSARDLAARIPGARAYEVRHTAAMSVAQEHNWNMTTPELFSRTLRAWLTDQPLPTTLQPLGGR
jgi:pimeloyl-ACP methyl ester carboxylesterase